MPQEQFSTLEEARAEIIRVNELLTAAETERDALKSQNATQAEDLRRVRELNQQYFLKLSAQILDHEKEDPDKEEKTPTCEEFAKTLTI